MTIEDMEQIEDSSTIELSEEELEIIVGGVAKSMSLRFPEARGKVAFDDIKDILQSSK